MINTKKLSLLLSLLIGLYIRRVSSVQNENPALKNLLIQNEKKTNEFFEEAVKEFLQQLQHETQFENILLYKHNITAECPFERLLSEMEYAVLLVGTSPIKNFQQHFSKNILVLLCEQSTSDGHNMGHWRYHELVRPLIGLQHLVYFTNGNVTSVSEYCRSAFSAAIANIVIILPDFDKSKIYYNCQRYPESNQIPFNVKNFQIDKPSTPIFNSQFLNMYGDIIWTMSDQLAPRTIFYHDHNGNLKMTGYVGELVTLYAKRRNATLRFRYPIIFDKVTNIAELVNATRNGSIDISTALIVSINPQFRTFISYPYDVVNYCAMVPVPKELPIREIFVSITRWRMFLYIFVYLFIFGILIPLSHVKSWRELSWSQVPINFEMIRAYLGQPFVMPRRPRTLTKLICFEVSFASYLVCSMYQAFLQSFLTHPPLLPPIRSAQEAKKMHVGILFPADELYLLQGTSLTQLFTFLQLSTIIDDYTEFIKIRDSLDTRYMFPVTDRRWDVFFEQQKCFAKRLFYFTNEFCVHNILPLSLMTRIDLPYREDFNTFIMDIHAVGLVNLWSSRHFYTMVRLGLAKLEDISQTDDAQPFSLDDFYYIWIVYGIMLGIATISFLGEIFIRFLRNWKNYLRQKKLSRRKQN